MKYKALGTEGITIAVILAVALCSINFFMFEPRSISGETGICLPSLDMWPLPPLWGWGLNTLLIVGAGFALQFLNKTYSLIQTTATVFPSAFLVFTASCPWLTARLSAATIMVCVAIISFYILFDAYKRLNATQEVFLVATLLSVGTMFQYAFLMLIPAFLLMLIPLKVFRIKEITAFLLGLAAPYWVGVGMGWIPVENFRLPTLTSFHYGDVPAGDLLAGLLTIGFTALWSFLLALNNAVKLYAGNTRRRLLNNTVIILGLASLLGMVVDFNNLTAYLPSFYVAAALQLANAYALWQIPRGRLWLGLLAMTYTVAFFITL